MNGTTKAIGEKTKQGKGKATRQANLLQHGTVNRSSLAGAWHKHVKLKHLGVWIADPACSKQHAEAGKAF